MIKKIMGDITTSKANVICHQVNCQGVMGAGLAKQIRAVCPKHYSDYLLFSSKAQEPIKLLGKVVFTEASDTEYIAGIFGQLFFGRSIGRVYTNYGALSNGLKEVKAFAQKLDVEDCRIAIPYKIGCGLAGGDWNVVEQIITEIFDSFNGTVEIWKY